MTEREDHQHQPRVLLTVVEGLEDVDDNVEDVEGRPADEEDDGDRDQHPVCLLSSLHLSRSSVGREIHVALSTQTLTDSRNKKNIS